jgi:hypothetical protein
MKNKIFTILFSVMLSVLFISQGAYSQHNRDRNRAHHCDSLKKAECSKKRDCKWIKGKRDHRTRQLTVRGKCVRN